MAMRMIAAALALAIGGAAAAQSVRISDLPAAQPISGTESIPMSQAGATRAATPAQIATWLDGRYQPLDTDLSAIATLSTQPFGRSLLTVPDAATARSIIGVTASGADVTYLGRTSNLSDLANPATARTNLGVAIGSNVEAWDVDLDAIAALGTQPFGRSLLTASSAAAARSLDGSAASGANNDITSIAGLTTPLSLGQGGTGSSTASAARSALGVTATGADTSYLFRTSNLSDLGNVATARSNLGLGTLATQSGTFSGTSSGTNTGDQTITLSGDATGSGTGAFALTLATVNSTPGSYGGALIIPTLTTNGKGLVTASGSVALGTVPIGQGGTGATTAAAARSGLGAAASGSNGDITAITGLTTAIAVSEGGTGGTTAATARSGLGAAASGANSDLTSLTGLTTPLSVAQGGTAAVSAAAARSSLSAAASGANTDITSITGSAARWTTARTLSFTGDATGSGSVDGSANVATALTLASSGATAGTYGSTAAVPVLTVSAKGLVTAASTAALGTAATANTGTSGATVPLLNAANTWSAGQTFTSIRASSELIIPTSNPTSYGTATQLAIGEATNTTSYQLHIGYYNTSGTYFGSVDTLVNGSPATLVLNGSGGSVSVGGSLAVTGGLTLGAAPTFPGLTLIPASNPTSVATAKQLVIGEATNTTSYQLHIGYYNTSGTYFGSVDTLLNGSPATLVLNGSGGSVTAGGTLTITNAPTYASDSAAGSAGLTTGQVYKTSDGSGGYYLKIKS